MRRNKLALALSLIMVMGAFAACSAPEKAVPAPTASGSLVNMQGQTIAARYNPPKGYSLDRGQPNSFAQWLSALVLLDDTAQKQVQLSGLVAESAGFLAMGTGTHEFPIDSLVHLKLQYEFDQKQYDKISFTLSDGFVFAYTKWMQGYRPVARQWVLMGNPSETQEDFDAYLQSLYQHLSREELQGVLSNIAPEDISPGDIYWPAAGQEDIPKLIVSLARANDGTGDCLMIFAMGTSPQAPIMIEQSGRDIGPWFLQEDMDVDQGNFYRFNW